MAKNSSLNKAGIAKQDEFYTQIADIEREMRHYTEHFKDKTIFCNCDDPITSNFWLYFELNFEKLGLKKLIATHYETDKPSYKLELMYDIDRDGKVNKRDIVKTTLKQNGDFRSQECIEIMKEADIVITNPPFSLFREYIAQLMQYDKKFIVIGSMNAITYKEIFPLIRDNKIWLGYGFKGGNAYFSVSKQDTSNYANGVYNQETGLVKFRNCNWFTNLDIAKRHESIMLYRRYEEGLYRKYDNYDAINIDKLVEIPIDYYGIMGVPITYIAEYSPEQFEIIGMIAGNIKGLAGITSKIGKDGPYIDGKLKYGRILIKRKDIQQ